MDTIDKINVSCVKTLTGRKKGIKSYLVDGHVVSVNGVDEVRCVGLGADVNFSLLSPHQEQVVLQFVEVKGCAAACTGNKA
jgi:hypothetical protein